MKISKEVVLKVAKLSRLCIDNKEAEIFVPRLEKVIEWVQQLHNVDVADVEPLVNPMEDRVTTTVWREDSIDSGNQAKEILENAPQQSHNMFQVPKVLE